MSKPLVAIVGRPNVGKSTIINGLAQKRVSIVEDIPGVTRDRIYCDVRWLDREFTMIDTGGIEFRDEADQISYAPAGAACHGRGRCDSFCRRCPCRCAGG